MLLRIDFVKMLEKIIDILMFREGTEEEADGSLTPIITTGSIIWGALLRSSLIILIGFLFFDSFEMRQYLWILLFLLWFGAAFPAWHQYQTFEKRLKVVEEETLCGSCKHFDSSSQLCRIFDEHVTKNYIPCEGLNWEPKSYEEKNEVN
jgi:hypothetical protein